MNNHFMTKSVMAGAAFLVVFGAIFSMTYATTISGNPTVINIIGSGAQVTWTTDIASDSQVSYGPTANLGSYSSSRCDEGGNVVTHCVNLTGLSSNTTYYYKVMSYVTGGAGLAESSISSFTSASSSSGGAPDTPTGFTNGTPTTSTIPLIWTAAPNATHYNLEHETAGSGSWTYLSLGTTLLTSYTDSGLNAGTSYNYRLQACREGYGCSSYAYLMGVSTIALSDTTAPTAPVLSATAVSSSQINLSWSASSDNVGVSGYKIFRGTTLLGTVTTTSYSDSSGLAPGTLYTYYVKAVDAAGNESTPSSSVSATTLASESGGGGTADTQAPVAPTTQYPLVATKDEYNEVDLRWDAYTDNVAVIGYAIYRSMNALWTMLGNSSGTTYIDTTVSPSTAYYYAIKAYDAAGNVSATSTPLFLNVPLQAPTITSAYFVANGSYGSSTNLLWSDVSSETSYKVYERLSGATAWTLAKIRTSATGLSDAVYAANTVSVQVRAYSSGTYEYKVSACGTVGCSDSTLMSVVMGTTPTVSNDTTAPTPPNSFSYTATISSLSFTFSGATDNVGVTGYKVYRNGTYLKTVLEPLCTDTNLSPGTAYAYYVLAVDAANNISAPSQTINATTLNDTATADTTAPTISSIHSNNIVGGGTDVTWTTDDPSDSRVVYGTVSSTGMSYTYLATSRCDAGGLVVSHCVKLAPALSTMYYYRAISKNAALLETISPEYTFFSATSTVILNATTTTTTLTNTDVTVSVIFGTPYCEGSVGKTPLTLSVTPYGGAFLKFSMLSPGIGTTTLIPGTYPMGNGTYHWEAVAYSGYTLSGKTSADFTLSKSCASTATTTTTSTESTSTPTTTTTTTKTLPTGTVPVAPSNFRVSSTPTSTAIPLTWVDNSSIEDKVNIERKLTTDSSYSGTRLTQLSANTTSYTDTSVVAATAYDYRVQACLSGYGCSAYVYLIGVKTAPAPVVTTTTSSTEVATSQTTTSNTSVTTATAPTASSADTITTTQQYTHYCDDPAHQIECQTYAATQVASPVEAPATPVVNSDSFAVLQSGGGTLPAGATTPQELQSACTQTQYASSCAELFVSSGVTDRAAADKVVAQSLALEAQTEKILSSRIGARAFLDTDNDGITDYDEVNIYHTDPKKADTNGDKVSDGAQLLAGIDPLTKVISVIATTTTGKPSGKPAQATSTSTAPQQKIAYEDPKFAGNIKSQLLAVTAVAAVTTKAESATSATGEQQATTTKVKLEGKALPNSFVTIFVYSEPIVVTVKTDASGSWTYTMDKELADGRHEVYSAITDVGGRILAKSEPLPFVKEAAAVSFGAATLLPRTTEQAPGFFSGGSLYALLAILVGILGIAFLLIGWMTRRTTSVASSEMNSEQTNDRSTL